MNRIPIAGPWVTEREIEYVADAARHGWFDKAGEYPRRFEEAFAEYIGVKHAVSVPHCTAAIHLALAALGIGPGDEVVIPDLTWIASSAPIRYVGATPVFADIDPATWCLSADAFDAVLTPRTRAAIVVDLYGNVPDYDAIRAVAAGHKVKIVEDAAEAFGSVYHGRRAGGLGDAGVFSFHGSKTMTTGEGGMFVTDDEELYRRVLFLRDHGRTPGDTTFFNTEVAFKYRMSGLQAAFGLAQVERAGELIERKREIFSWYRELLAPASSITLNAEPAGTVNSYWMVTAVFDPALGLSKQDVIAHLRDDAIDSRPFFNPLSSLPAYAGEPLAAEAQQRNRHARAVSPYGVNLPSGFNMTRELVEAVAASIRRIVQPG